MTNLKNVEEISKKFNNDVELLTKELRRIQSVKSRLKKQKGKSSYENEMTEVVKYEQVLKEAKQLLEPKQKTVTTFEKEDVEKLDYDETIKALNTIRSKKANSRWLTTEEGNNEEFKNACLIEEMLLEHKETIKPVNPEYVRKSEVQTIIDTLESSGKLSQERIIELLKELL